jgi:hypothetical protein
MANVTKRDVHPLDPLALPWAPWVRANYQRRPSEVDFEAFPGEGDRLFAGALLRAYAEWRTRWLQNRIGTFQALDRSDDETRKWKKLEARRRSDRKADPVEALTPIRSTPAELCAAGLRWRAELDRLAVLYPGLAGGGLRRDEAVDLGRSAFEAIAKDNARGRSRERRRPRVVSLDAPLPSGKPREVEAPRNVSSEVSDALQKLTPEDREFATLYLTGASRCLPRRVRDRLRELLAY